MLYTIISDIHSNLPALQGFLRIYNPKSVVICLGDIVGYGASPSDCLRITRDTSSSIISGNHERMLSDLEQRHRMNTYALRAIEWTENKLTPGEKMFLDSLPSYLELNDSSLGTLLFSHGSPLDPDEYLITKDAVRLSLDFLKTKNYHFCFVGHTHIPGWFNENAELSYEINNDFVLDKDRFYIINPGSIGQPRDRNCQGSFCEFDSETATLVFRRFDYAIKESIESIKQNGLPLELGNRLLFGI